MNYPRIYIFRSYVATAGSCTVNGLTNGNSYVTLRIPDNVNRDLQQDVTITHFPGKKAQIFRWDQWKKNILRFEGFVKEESEASTITCQVACDQYFNRAMDEGTDAEGLVIVFNSSVYHEFSNEDYTAKDAARGVLKALKTQWSKDENLGFYVNGEFEVVWD